jgi:hypothetical protein
MARVSGRIPRHQANDSADLLDEHTHPVRKPLNTD